MPQVMAVLRGAGGGARGRPPPAPPRGGAPRGSPARARRTPPPPPPAAAPTETDVITQLQQLGKLRDDGVLTEDEFASQKARILGS